MLFRSIRFFSDFKTAILGSSAPESVGCCCNRAAGVVKAGLAVTALKCNGGFTAIDGARCCARRLFLGLSKTKLSSGVAVATGVVSTRLTVTVE